MNFGVVFIIFNSVQTVLCSQFHDIGNDTCDLCTISWFRRKRAQTEYTRWRATQETTQEFIVKVLDDDFTTFSTPKIAAVNIQPLIKDEKKIIVGGALVPPVTSLTTFSEPIDYTRFIPPTTIPLEALEKAKIRSILEDLIVTPRGLIKSDKQISHKKTLPVKHIHRDESPPSGPQFLGRTQSSLAQQYAPVAPVSFHRGTTVAPLTPRSSQIIMYKTPIRPTRTFPLRDVIKPIRTTSKTSFHNIFLFDNNYITDDQRLLSHITIPALNDPQDLSTSLTTLSTMRHQDDDFNRPTDDIFVKWRRNKYDPNINDEKDSELSYNAMGTNYEEDMGRNLKIEKIDSSKEDQYELPLADVELSKAFNESVEETNEFDNTTELESNAYYDEEKHSINVTLQHTPTRTPVLNRMIAQETTKKVQKKRKFCSMVKLRQLNFNSPRTLPEIVAQLKQWAETSPVAKWVDITNGNYTTMENPIYMMIVDDPSSGQIISAKKTVMVIAGIQGRDHHAVAAAMYVLYQLIERSEAHADLLTKYRFWIIPIFNPDGYDYSMTFPHKREWTKNLRQKWDSCKGRESCEACEFFGLRCTIQTCYGVNLDRNFEYQWIPTEELRAEHPCGSLYAGERQLSEAETRALTHFLHDRRSPLYTFIAFKEGDVLGVLYPYSHTRKRRAFDNVYRQRASHAASAAYSIGGRPYVAGQTSEFLPLYAGGIEDWVDGHLGIDNTYTVMMFRPSDSYNSKLITEVATEHAEAKNGRCRPWINVTNLDVTCIEETVSAVNNLGVITLRVVHEAYAAMDTLLLQSRDNLGPPVVTLTTAKASLCASFSTILIATTPIFFVISY